MSQHSRVVVERSFNHSLGIGSMVLGVLASVLLFLPSMPLNAIASAIFALVIAFVGVGLALVGLFQSIRRQGEGIGYPIVGLTLNGIPTALCLLAIWAIVSARMESAAEVKQEAEREQQRIALMAAENQRVAQENQVKEAERQAQLALEQAHLEQKRLHAQAETKRLEAEAKVLAEVNAKQEAIERKRREAEEAIARQKQMEEDRIRDAQIAAQKREDAKKLAAKRKATAQEKTIEYGNLLAKFIKANNEKPPQKLEEVFSSKKVKSNLELIYDSDPWGNSYKLGQRASTTKGKALFYVYAMDPDTQMEITADQGTLGLIDLDKMDLASKDVSELSSPLWDYMVRNKKRAPKTIDELKPFIKKNTSLKDPWGKPYRIGTQDLGERGIMHYIYALHPDGKTEIQGIGAQGTRSEDE